MYELMYMLLNITQVTSEHFFQLLLAMCTYTSITILIIPVHKKILVTCFSWLLKRQTLYSCSFSPDILLI